MLCRGSLERKKAHYRGRTQPPYRLTTPQYVVIDNRLPRLSLPQRHGFHRILSARLLVHDGPYNALQPLSQRFVQVVELAEIAAHKKQLVHVTPQLATNSDQRNAMVQH